MKRPTIKPTPARLLLLLAAVLAASCRQKGGPAVPAAGPVPINVYTVQRGTASYHDAYPGTVVALSQVDIRSEVSGYLTGLFFTEGQPVRKGQKLYDIERTRYAAAYEAAQANLRVAEAGLTKARGDADRYTRLHAQDAVARQTYDYALAALQSAESQVAAARAQAASARSDLAHAVITAPFDGTVGISLVRLGAFVTAGETVLNTISSDQPTAVDFAVNEKDLARFRNLAAKPPAPTDSTFTLSLPDGSQYPHPGRLETIDRAVDPQTGTFRVRLAFPNPGRGLKTGTSCNVRVRNGGTGAQLLAPYQAVTEQLGEYFVYVVAGGKAHLRKITPGPTLGDQVVVLAGLQPGERIVVDGLQKLRDGAPVQTGNVPAQTARLPR